MNFVRCEEVRMKKPSRWPIFMACVFIVLVTVLIAETLMVKVQTTYLRKDPQFYASTVAVLKAGEVVEKISASSGWYQVRTANGAVGWLHSSAVQTGKFRLAAMDKSLRTQATADEIALAGKGFDKQVEENYKAQNSGTNFAAVERMLRLQVSQDQLLKFLKEGKLGIYGGRP